MLVLLAMVLNKSHGQRNMASIDIFKLMQLKASVKYERVLPRSSGLGAAATVYFYNSLNIYRPFIVWEEGRYGGYKLELFYKYYFGGFAPKGMFIQTKLIFGHFKSEIEYRYYRASTVYDTFISPGKFYATGAGFSFGHQWLIEEKFPFELSVGLQFFPMLVSRSIEHRGVIYERNDNVYLPGTASWYIAGPGSVVEIGLKFGLLFR